ncbi:hypothetical protein CQA62_03980 [Helicobacter cholecystus]|uniref:Uncharacterized protein n=1 Tax=Helicobacter cholecystus TaxID=45498 RepID=A0A3D8IVL1_9HELI|nr:hypothetical protein CQA62_03980 [Helicobacter cholecystus]
MGKMARAKIDFRKYLECEKYEYKASPRKNIVKKEVTQFWSRHYHYNKTRELDRASQGGSALF